MISLDDGMITPLSSLTHPWAKGISPCVERDQDGPHHHHQGQETQHRQKHLAQFQVQVQFQAQAQVQVQTQVQIHVEVQVQGSCSGPCSVSQQGVKMKGGANQHKHDEVMTGGEGGKGKDKCPKPQHGI